jgi:hypothetical protein
LEFHSLLGHPAKILYYKNMEIYVQHWFKKEKTHRQKLNPAMILYFKNGKIKESRWNKK